MAYSTIGRFAARAAVLVGAVLTAACTQSPLAPTGVESATAGSTLGLQAKGGGASGDALVADLVPGDSACPAAPSTLGSTTPGNVNDIFTISWGHTRGLIVTPDGSSYSLTDDVGLQARFSKRDATISAVTLRGQDVEGPDGIQHETDAVPVAPQTASAGGFTLHVHAANVVVHRLSGHTGGKRVGPIGTICIGDVIYRQP